jgi:hypothetical protein
MRRYETHLHSTLNRRRTRAHPGRITLVIDLCFASLPDTACQRSRRTSQRHCQTSRLRRPDRAQRHQRFQRGGPCRAPEAVLSPPSAAHDHSRRKFACFTRSLASQSPRVWHREQRLVSGAGSTDHSFARTNCRPHHWSFCPPRACAFGSQLETGQTLDKESRSDVSPKKPCGQKQRWKRHDRMRECLQST